MSLADKRTKPPAAHRLTSRPWRSTTQALLLLSTCCPVTAGYRRQTHEAPAEPPWHTAHSPTHPNWIVRRAFKRALRRATEHGTTMYRGRLHTAQTLGACLPVPHSKTRAGRTDQPCSTAWHHDKLISYNAGGLTSNVLDELYTWLDQERPAIACVQETHWHEAREYTVGGWSVISSGVTERNAGVVTVVSTAFAKPEDVRHRTLVDGRILHARIECRFFNLDVVNVYQHPWRSHLTATDNKRLRAQVWDQLDLLLRGLPARNRVVVMGDFNAHLPNVGGLTGPCRADNTSRSETDSGRFDSLVSLHQLTALNTWACRDPHTFVHAQDRGKSQIDYALARPDATGQAKQATPVDCPVASWRGGGRHWPVVAKLKNRKYPVLRDAQPLPKCTGFGRPAATPKQPENRTGARARGRGTAPRTLPTRKRGPWNSCSA